MADEREGGVQDDMLPTLVQWFEDSEQSTQNARTDAERDRDYYDGKQLTAQEIAALEARKQPAIVVNRIRRKIDYLQGLEKQSRQDPKAYPRNPQDSEAADAATDALRYVADSERFPQTASNAWENRLIEGACGVDVCVEEGGPEGYRVRIKRVPWDRMFWDPHSAAGDFSDAKYLGLVLWMDEADVLARWPDARDVVENCYAAETHSDTYDDRPKFGVWSNKTRKRLRIAQIYWDTPDGWQYAAYTHGGFLDEAQPSPYLDEDDRPANPLIFGSGYIDRDNARYGVVRDMIGPQDEVNKRRSKALHLLSVRQVIAEQGAVLDVDEARRELAKPDGYIEVGPTARFDIQQTNDLAAGQAQLLAEAKAELDFMGPNASMQGKQSGDASGRAIALSQQGGLVEVGMLLDAHRDWKRRVYEAVWQRVRQFWTGEVWVRVTDDENKPRFVGLNVPQVAVDPATGAEIVMGVQNEVARTMVDIVIDESPDVVTLQSEQQQVIRDIMQAVPPLAPALIEPFIRSTNLRNKDGIIERVQQMMQAPQGDGGAAAAAQADQQARAAEAQMKAQAEQEKLAAQVQMKEMEVAAQREAEAAQIAAEDRRKAAELEMQWQIALLNANLKAQDREASAGLERERMTVEDQRAERAGAMEREKAQATAQPAPDLGGELRAALSEMLGPIAQRVEEVAQHAMAPREIVRGPDGKAVGVKVGNVVRQIARGADGKAMGLQ